VTSTERDPFLEPADSTPPLEESKKGRDVPRWRQGHSHDPGQDNQIPSPTPSPLSDAQTLTDHYIRTLVAKNITKLQAKATKPGYVYIVHDPERPGMLKIGTSKDFPERFDQIEKHCEVDLSIIFVSPPIFAEARAEKLAQDELKLFNTPFHCSKCVRQDGNPQKHKEWFKVDYKLAEKIVKKWTTFMDHKPYTADGSLDGFWLYKLYLEKSDLAGEDKLRSLEDCAQMRHDIWLKFTTPNRWHKARYHWRNTLQAIRRFDFWKGAAFFLFLFSLLVSFIEISFGTRMHKTNLLVQIVQLLPYFLIQPLKEDVQAGSRRPSDTMERRRSSVLPS
jgi:hypothetical protein